MLVSDEQMVGMSDISMSKDGFYGKIKWTSQAKREKVAAIRGNGHDI